MGGTRRDPAPGLPGGDRPRGRVEQTGVSRAARRGRDRLEGAGPAGGGGLFGGKGEAGPEDRGGAGKKGAEPGEEAGSAGGGEAS